ncbi:MAG: hypothetical protein PHD82_05835 [Candidatus Riflebacteria bacterium]|jgi:hypothetical protein|nr:hypothetical protein [Candidatus Riflebacteria bacterium]
MSRRNAFSLVEVMIALIFMSFAFLPIYNLFRFGSQGTVNNVYEVTGTNYASDLINFVRDLRFYQIEKAGGKSDKITLKNDAEIKAFFEKIGLTAPPETIKPFERSLELSRFKGVDSRGPLGIVGWLSDLIQKRRSVPNYLIKVKVDFPRTSGGAGNDDVTLFSLVVE